MVTTRHRRFTVSSRHLFSSGTFGPLPVPHRTPTSLESPCPDLDPVPLSFLEALIWKRLPESGPLLSPILRLCLLLGVPFRVVIVQETEGSKTEKFHLRRSSPIETRGRGGPRVGPDRQVSTSVQTNHTPGLLRQDHG